MKLNPDCVRDILLYVFLYNILYLKKRRVSRGIEVKYIKIQHYALGGSEDEMRYAIYFI